MISWSIFNILQLLVDGVKKCWICAIFVIWAILKFNRKAKFVGGNGISVKLVCFEPNSTSHNKIMVVGFLWKIYQNHQYLKIFKISKFGMTPPKYWMVFERRQICQFPIFSKDFEVSDRSAILDVSKNFILMSDPNSPFYIKAYIKISQISHEKLIINGKLEMLTETSEMLLSGQKRFLWTPFYLQNT